MNKQVDIDLTLKYMELKMQIQKICGDNKIREIEGKYLSEKGFRNLNAKEANTAMRDLTRIYSLMIKENEDSKKNDCLDDAL
ncbi:MAG: hypothetical protein WC376_02195 [Candidatus Nanoarchaeia archaeon]